MQLVVHEQALGDELPRVDTPNATVYVLAAGTYRIAAVDPDWSEVVVRAGQAEVVTRGSSARLADGEAIEVEGDRVHRAAAAGEDGLERWARRLDSEALVAASDYVEPELRYAAAPLYRYGSWVERRRPVRLAAARSGGLAALLGRTLGLHPERPDLGRLPALGLGDVALRLLGLRAGLRLDLVPGPRLQPGLGVLVLGTVVRRLVPGGLLHALLRLSRQLVVPRPLPPRDLWLGGRRLGRLLALELRRRAPARRPPPARARGARASTARPGHPERGAARHRDHRHPRPDARPLGAARGGRGGAAHAPRRAARDGPGGAPRRQRFHRPPAPARARGRGAGPGWGPAHRGAGRRQSHHARSAPAARRRPGG